MNGLKEVAEKAEKSSSTEVSMAAARVKMGLIFKQLGQTDEALRQFQRSYEIFKARVALKPDSDVAKGNLAVALTLLGETSQSLNRDMTAALDYYQQADTLRAEMYRHPRPSEPLTPTSVKQHLAESYTRVGVTYWRLGEPARALEEFHKAMALRQELAKAAPNNPAVRLDLARSHHAVGEMSFRMDDPAA